jgi:hypothetical protein
MWEEDPRYQQENYRFLVWGVGIIGVLTLLCSIITGDWALTKDYLTVVLVVLAAVLVYCAIIWAVGHTAAVVIRVRRKAFRK